MSDVSNVRRGRKSRPSLEPMEGRSLLSAGMSGVSTLSVAGTGVQAEATSSSTGRVRELTYTLPSGAHVTVTLYGSGTLAGSSLDASGALNLIFSGTNANSGIIGHVQGGGGYAPLANVLNANVPANSSSGIGGTLLNLVNLKNFDLIAGGRVNLTSGVHLLFLHSTAADTQVNLRELPESISGSNTASMNGETLTYQASSSGAETLIGVSGVFSPVANPAAGATVSAAPGAPTTNNPPNPAPPGLVISIDHVNGPTRGTGLGNPEIFGYDPTTNELIAFDITTGKPVLVIPNALPSAAGTEAGVALAHNRDQLVVMISDGTNVYAYDPMTGARVGQFSLAPLKADGLPAPTRLGSFDAFTAVADPTAGTNGEVQAINVTESLATGQAVLLGTPFPESRAFSISGGLASVAGSGTLFSAGGAHFDPYQPNQFELGIASLIPNGLSFSEASRNPVLTSTGATLPSNASGGLNASSTPSNALGSVDQQLALVTSASHGVNTVSLISPTTFRIQGNFNLAEANRLSDLTSTFRPALAGAALVDAQGNVQSFRAHDATGLVLSDQGKLNLTKINQATDTTVVGLPIQHVALPVRNNVLLVSSTRVVADRSGVNAVARLNPTGPLLLP